MTTKEGFWLRPEEVALITTVIEDKELVEARHAQLIEAGSRLFEKKGYHTTTIREIVKESGLGIGSIYQYVKNKEEILFLILVYILRQYESRLAASIATTANPREQLISAIKTYYKIVNEESDKVLLAYRETQSLDEDHRMYIMELELLTNNIFKKSSNKGSNKTFSER
ncbi:TetR/AcrR family transcriptional regulator [Caldalkalibacillus thermarum TA2.A1]|uniref:TetR/AcrR family transcriptional regulator n=1 Tax=Caldalkalibacillus thermarum (strain TA2.A1) TaxID=986075 RepID=A0A8X8L6K7_CALTT|nr:TetR/AcrR family transcriptional regulator [Caldalkalibacillus thermarum]QZT33037.1 TetR/AcrR family transcriptional regulator [Caldalkalibacillus thermarum TA2.A1]